MSVHDETPAETIRRAIPYLLGRDPVSEKTTAPDAPLAVGDRLRFDNKATSWLVRAVSRDGRYALATASMFGDVHYTILDRERGERGPLNVIGGGMGIETTSGPDEAIDDTMERLTEGWEVSRRNYVPTRITRRTEVSP